MQRERETVEAQQIILEQRDVKLLADTVESPKVKGRDQMGRPIIETFSPATTRKVIEAATKLLKAIPDFADQFDAIYERAENAAAQWDNRPEHDKERLTNNATERAKIQRDANEKMAELQKGLGRQETAVYLSESDLDFIRGRFEDRDDLQGDKEMRKRIVAISDALKKENVKAVDLPTPKPAGDDRNGKPALALVGKEE